MDNIETQPIYIQEDVSTRNDAYFGFVRSESLAPDGIRLVADSGVYNPAAISEGQIYIFGPGTPSHTAFGVSGVWTSGHGQQFVANINNTYIKKIVCPFRGLYQAEWIGPDALGAFAQPLLDAPYASCAAN
jgi:hypothetical protein